MNRYIGYISHTTIVSVHFTYYLYLLPCSGLACRDEERPAPFGRISANPSEFIDAEYLPADISIKDPRSMKLNCLIAFFKHISAREASHGLCDAFRFKAVLSSRKKGTICEARYKYGKDGEISAEIEEQAAETLIPHIRPKRRKANPKIDLQQTLLNSNEHDGQSTDNGADEDGSENDDVADVADALRGTGLYTPDDSPAPAPLETTRTTRRNVQG